MSFRISDTYLQKSFTESLIISNNINNLFTTGPTGPNGSTG